MKSVVKLSSSLLSVVLGLATVSLMSGCTRENPAFNPDPLLPGECRQGLEVSESFEQFERPGKLDLLVVVTSGGRTATTIQRFLADAMIPMLERLEEAELDVRVGVMTTHSDGEPGLAPAGNLGPGCESNTTRVASSAQRSWKSIAACNVQQGEAGDGFQRSLEVVYRSLVTSPESLTRFRRDDARLLVLIVANEDDCSAREIFAVSGDIAPRNGCAWNQDKLIDPTLWARAIRREATTPEGISLAVIAGPPSTRVYEQGQAIQPVCESRIGPSYSSSRLQQAAQAFDTSGRFYSLCVNELDVQLDMVAQELAIAERITFCPALPLVHEPLAVDAVDGLGQERPIYLGAGGYRFLGATASCETGALQFDAEALRDAQSVTTRYCVDP
jgi:hypothetical protein